MTIAFARGVHHVTAAELRDAVGGIAASLERLDGEVAALRSEWSGAANDAYIEAHQRWSAVLADLTSVLTDAASALETAGDAYVTADDWARRAWS